MGTVFERPVDVRWRDVDALGHVNHAVFLTYLEEARDAFYSAPSAVIRSTWLPGLKLTCARRSAIPDRRVTVRIEVERLGTTSLTTRETILTPSAETAAEARVVTVHWDAANRKPVPFSPAERTELAAAMTGDPSRPSTA